jgi:hypothetical protein
LIGDTKTEAGVAANRIVGLEIIETWQTRVTELAADVLLANTVYI